MVHRDPDTGQFIDGDGGHMVDYSDFEYQNIWVTQQHTGATATGQYLHEIEALPRQGGLRPNQVAELVYLELTAKNEAEAGSAGADDLGIRGVFGVDLAAQDDLTSFGDDPGVAGETTTISDNQSTGNLGIVSEEQNEVFVQFTNGGAGTVQHVRQYRAPWMTGRGPVLDADDNLSMVLSTVNNDDDADYNVSVQLIFDVMELDNARSEFSIPG